MTIKTLTEEIDALEAAIADLQVQLKRAGEDREKENKVFQTTVADQRETQKLLKAALSVLGEFYGKKAAAASLVQGKRQEPVGPPPPAGFETYTKNSASGGVMGLLQQIINDAKAMEAETIRSEEDAQKAYEDFVKETIDKKEIKAKSESDLVDAKEAKAAAELELEQEKESVMVELEQLS